MVLIVVDVLGGGLYRTRLFENIPQTDGKGKKVKRKQVDSPSTTHITVIGPAIDGMVLSRRVLPTVLRRSVFNAAARVRAMQGIHSPHVQRAALIRKLVKASDTPRVPPGDLLVLDLVRSSLPEETAKEGTLEEKGSSA
jgi:hypothetical protein